MLNTALGGLALGLPALAGCGPASPTSAAGPPAKAGAKPDLTYRKLPRWRGFNLQEKFQDQPDDLSKVAPEWSFYNEPFKEADFRMIAGFGFDFVRLPMSYKCWIKNGNWREFDEARLREIDQAVAWGRQYKLHVCLNFHRAPGFCINPPVEPLSLWTDREAQQVCALHWGTFAKRYQGIPNSELSFDLLNEPYNPTDAQYENVVKILTTAIYAADPNRLVIADGNGAGYNPVPALAAYRVAQSNRGYVPKEVTHFRAAWVEEEIRSITKLPEWPFHSPSGEVWDRARLREMYRPWQQLAAAGTGVMMGEYGVYNRTPHAVALGFVEDLLAVLKENDWGWSMWCFRGSMGILDSGRRDVAYENYQGHQLDRQMLTILQKS